VDYPKEKIEAGANYYALEFSADDKGQVIVSGQTMWTGWADKECRVELRKGRLVDPHQMADLWIGWEMPFHVVNSGADFLHWFLLGGHALVKQSIAEQVMTEQISSSPCVRTGMREFTGLESLPDTLFHPAPTRKQRMAILKRDDYRCRICGRRPDRNVDIELHVHHIRPHAKGGATHEDNLITLCATCHGGLDPHYEVSLFSLLNECGMDAKDAERKKYLLGVKAYRESTQKFLNELKGLGDTAVENGN
jgi:hypothetical protein